MGTFIGVDPDLLTPGLAICDEQHVVWVGSLHVLGDRTEDAAVAAMAEQLAYQTALFAQLSAHRQVRKIAGVVIEQPTIYPRGRTRRPMDILRLAQVAGMFVYEFARLGFAVHLVPPKKWKGDVPKTIHQREVLTRYGMSAMPFGEGTIPEEPQRSSICGSEKVKPGQWIHVMDAIGLARYGAMGMRSLGKERAPR